VCFVARWDRRKRPERFFELAQAFPRVRFLAAGKSRDPSYEQMLRQQYGGLANVEMLGFVDQFRGPGLSQLLGHSWILVNTAAREGLPNAFLEAAAHGCAILSAVNPDGFASRFGQHVQDDNFERGLSCLLEGDRWRELGEQGRDYVQRMYSTTRAMDCHMKAYQELLSR
jgi:glycosyltransferase involved in cell wall biosynthesis